MNLKAIRYESTSLNRIAADKSYRVIVASEWCFMHQSIPSAKTSPLGYPRDFAPIFSPGPEDLYHRSELPGGCPGVGPIIKVPSCQLMPHEGIFQLQTDLPSIATL